MMHYELRSYRQARRQFSVKTYIFLAIWLLLALVQWIIVCMIQEARDTFRELYYVCFITFALGILLFTIFIFCENLRYVRFLNFLLSLIIVELQIVSLFGLVVYSWWADVLAFYGLCVLIIFICLIIGTILPRRMDLTLDVAILFIIAFIFLMVAVFCLLFLLIVWDTVPYTYIVVEIAITITIMFFVMYHAQTIHGNRFAEMRLDDYLLGSLILFHDFLIIYWLTFFWQVKYRLVTSDSYVATSTPSADMINSTLRFKSNEIITLPVSMETNRDSKVGNRRVGYDYRGKHKERDRNKANGGRDWPPSRDDDDGNKALDQIPAPPTDRTDWSVYRNRNKNRPYDEKTRNRDRDRGKSKNRRPTNDHHPPSVNNDWQEEQPKLNQDTDRYNERDRGPNQHVPADDKDIETEEWLLTTHNDDLNVDFPDRFSSPKKHFKADPGYEYQDVAEIAQSPENSAKVPEIVEEFKDEVEILSPDDNEDTDEELNDEETLTTVDGTETEEAALAAEAGIYDKLLFTNLNKSTRKFDL